MCVHVQACVYVSAFVLGVSWYLRECSCVHVSVACVHRCVCTPMYMWVVNLETVKGQEGEAHTKRPIEIARRQVDLEPLTGERTAEASACYSREHLAETSPQPSGPRSLQDTGWWPESPSQSRVQPCLHLYWVADYDGHSSLTTPHGNNFCGLHQGTALGPWSVYMTTHQCGVYKQQ